MKYVLLLLAVFALLWMLRSGLRRRMRPPDGYQAKSKDAPQPMLTCAHCGVHLPRDEALPGRGGVFCDASHRSAFEAAHPES
jgi:uncharacterized protein